MTLPSLAAAILLAATPACDPRLGDGHVVRAEGAKAFVKEQRGGHREIVVRGVGPTARRHDSSDDEDAGCEIELAAFRQHFHAEPYALHARLGRHAIRVRAIDYDPATETLRTKGRLERTPKAARSTLRQSQNAMQLVYASTFIPFDSSF